MAYPIRQAADAAGDSVRRVIRAFHGSPHDFDRFDASKIGTGEGAQAYGHGLYFAENDGTARHYRDTLSGQVLVDGKPVDRNESHAYLNLADRAARGEDIFRMTADAEQDRALYADLVKQFRDNYQADPEGQGILASLGYAKNRLDLADEFLEAARRLRQSHIARNPGRMYEVEIGHAPEELIEYGRPFDSPAGSAAAQVLRDVDPGSIDARTLRQIQSGEWKFISPSPERANPYETAAQALRSLTMRPEGARALMDAGVPGVRYWDADSRGLGQGTRNYVIFPGGEDRIRILRKYGLLAPMALPALEQEENLGN